MGSVLLVSEPLNHSSLKMGTTNGNQRYWGRGKSSLPALAALAGLLLIALGSQNPPLTGASSLPSSFSRTDGRKRVRAARASPPAQRLRA